MNTIHEQPAALGNAAASAERRDIVSPDGKEGPRARDDEVYSLDIGWKDIVMMFFAVMTGFNLINYTNPRNRDGDWYFFLEILVICAFLYEPVKHLTAWVVKRVGGERTKTGQVRRKE